MESKFNKQYSYSLEKKAAPWWWPFQREERWHTIEKVVETKPTKSQLIELQKAFKVVDTDDNGSISREELKYLFRTTK
jgi:hypothetical protein